MTQCVSAHKLIEQSNRKTKMPTSPVALFDNYCENLLRKINYKMNGINIQVNLKQALSKQHQQPANKQTPRIMFFGADVIHPTNCTERFPSIAALVGSDDQLCTMSASRICKQWPDDGKCSIECIVRLEDIVEELLDYNCQLNQGQLPTQIVFFRDGVDDGQYSKVINFEIPVIKNAFKAAYANEKFTPLLTLFVVKKRHHTRFFMCDERSQQTSNIPIGACIDTTIVHPYQPTYYLNSHQVQTDVNHTLLYVCLLNEIGLSIDELQLLTHYLCFTDPRSSAAKAIPSVVHQADLAALKARDLFVDNNNNNERSTVSSGGNDKYYISLENPTIQNITCP
ncbi:unnamed protein product [Didymodactylos carnosus]|uniref:Piwi domain-containing protein n=1 Tax=Didymodactylos carnosus TaxID=1234261 RepID=A0A815BW14_9BILA|nr:unnamed protein product [Didymodactylos carnosus]CAF4066162.1 unnamed protein product [Didymodactylos carnosus]